MFYHYSCRQGLHTLASWFLLLSEVVSWFLLLSEVASWFVILSEVASWFVILSEVASWFVIVAASAAHSVFNIDDVMRRVLVTADVMESRHRNSTQRRQMPPHSVVKSECHTLTTPVGLATIQGVAVVTDTSAVGARRIRVIALTRAALAAHLFVFGL